MDDHKNRSTLPVSSSKGNAPERGAAWAAASAAWLGPVSRAALLALSLCVATQAPAALAQRGQVEPEASVETTDKNLASGAHFMISTANGLASEAGREILRAGGSAADAAIAAELVLGLVEPQSSGLGGGGFLLHWDEAKQQLSTYDGRETAPAAAKPDRFLMDGKPLDFETAVNSGLSIGTPGLVKLLATVHAKHGKLAWATLFEPAIRLAEEGFPVSRRLYFLLRWNGREKFSDAAARLFFDAEGKAPAIGSAFRNPEYAATLRSIAAEGASVYYSGPVAAKLVEAANGARRFASDLTLDDLARYTVKERPPLCVPYRTFKVCGMGPPSSGGVAVAQTLLLLEGFDLGSSPSDAMSAHAMHLIAEAEKLAYADRDRYLADPDFVSIPDGLMDKDYIASRRALINPDQAMSRPPAGEPPGLDKRAFGDDATLERAGTTHISVIDRDGNAVALTSTIEGAFGSGEAAAGFLLNNELTDFSFLPTDADGRPIANRVEGGKRPRSTMAPTIVFDQNGKVFAVTGSPGGGRIVLYVVKSLVGMIDWKLDAQQAIATTNFGSMGSALELEYSLSAVLDAIKLKTYGHPIHFDLMNSGLHVVMRRDGRLEGGADPRREGAALGD